MYTSDLYCCNSSLTVWPKRAISETAPPLLTILYMTSFLYAIDYKYLLFIILEFIGLRRFLGWALRLWQTGEPSKLRPHILTFIRSMCKIDSPALKMCASDLQNVMYTTYNKCASDLQQMCIRPTNLCVTGTLILSSNSNKVPPHVGRINKIKCTSDLYCCHSSLTVWPKRAIYETAPPPSYQFCTWPLFYMQLIISIYFSLFLSFKV